MRLGRERAVNKAAASSTKGIISTHFSDSLMKLAILSESTKLGLLLHNEATLHQINANPNFGLNKK